MNVGSLIIAVPLLAAVAACGDDDEAGTPADLSDEARRGAELVDSNGCTACHRSGGAATSFDGLYGSKVELADGTTVVADDEYLTRAIIDPGAEVAAGYSMTMPDNDLDDDEVAAVVAYLRELDSATEVTNASG